MPRLSATRSSTWLKAATLAGSFSRGPVWGTPWAAWDLSIDRSRGSATAEGTVCIGSGDGDSLRTSGMASSTTSAPDSASPSTSPPTSVARKSSTAGVPGPPQGDWMVSRRSVTSRIPPWTRTTSGRFSTAERIHRSRSPRQRSTSRSIWLLDSATQPPTASPHPGVVEESDSTPSSASSWPASDSASSSPTTIVRNGGGGAVVVEPSADGSDACWSASGAGRSRVRTRSPAMSATADTAAIATARRPLSRPPRRTGSSTRRNITVAAASVTAMRRPNSGHSDQPTRAGDSHRNTGQCSR